MASYIEAELVDSNKRRWALAAEVERLQAASKAMLTALAEIASGGAEEDPGEGEWGSMDEANTCGARSAAYEAAVIARRAMAIAKAAGVEAEPVERAPQSSQ